MDFPLIDPVILQIGPLALRWYGLMYLLGFAAAYVLILYLGRKKGLGLQKDDVADLLFYVVLGVIAGGRLGYCFFYNADYYLSHPLKIFAVWEGGMSFHGGLLGVILGSLLFARRRKLPILTFGDLLVTAAPIGLGLGRMGNFINAELWGRVTHVPWGIVFPGAGPLPRHPSQLYEAVLEGPVLLFLLLLCHWLKAPAGVAFGAFLAGYGSFRFLVEFFREPDAHLGLQLLGLSRGQWLCLPMILFGLAMIAVAVKKSRAQ